MSDKKEVKAHSYFLIAGFLAIYSQPGWAVSPQQALELNQSRLAKLEKLCISFLPDPKAAEATLPCGATVAELSILAAQHCNLIYRAFSEASQKSESLVLETLLWMQEKGTVRQGDGQVTILFSLSSDPSYPFNRTSGIENEALHISYYELDLVNRKLAAASKEPACASGAGKKALAALQTKWDGEERKGTVGQFHNELGMGIGDYLMAARISIEQGSFEEAQKALQTEHTGIKIRKAH